MSDDELLIFLLSIALSAVFLLRWALLLLALARVRRPTLPLLLAPPVGVAGVLATLLTAASWDVQGSPMYVVFYVAMGVAWLLPVTLALPLVGLHPRDDILDRGNAAAGWVTAGALVGGLAAFAGGNVGDGPGWWCVVFAAGLATVAWAAAWGTLELFARPTEHVTIDRDPAAALRLVGFLVATGIVAGRGAAGDWVSAARTVVEFTAAWPLVPLVVIAAALERRFAPTPERPVGDALIGAVIGLGYVVLALLAVFALGPPFQA